MKRNGTVALRKVNIGTWDSPVSRQFRINRIPQLWLYDGTTRVETSTRRVLKALEG